MDVVEIFITHFSFKPVSLSLPRVFSVYNIQTSLFFNDHTIYILNFFYTTHLCFSSILSKNTFFFVYFFNITGLKEREEIIGKNMIEIFEGRDDKLTKRTVIVDRNMRSRGQYISYTFPSGELGDLVITNMSENFNRNEDMTGK